MFRVIETLPLGTVYVTDGAREALARGDEDVAELLARHAAGDWGDVDPEQAWENDFAVQYGLRVVSSHSIRSGHHVIVVTEADRSLTTVMTPAEF